MEEGREGDRRGHFKVRRVTQVAGGRGRGKDEGKWGVDGGDGGSELWWECCLFFC